jgi:hypothetical protein
MSHQPRFGNRNGVFAQANAVRDEGRLVLAVLVLHLICGGSFKEVKRGGFQANDKLRVAFDRQGHTLVCHHHAP